MCDPLKIESTCKLQSTERERVHIIPTEAPHSSAFWYFANRKCLICIWIFYIRIQMSSYNVRLRCRLAESRRGFLRILISSLGIFKFLCIMQNVWILQHFSWPMALSTTDRNRIKELRQKTIASLSYSSSQKVMYVYVYRWWHDIQAKNSSLGHSVIVHKIL